jgi:cell division protein ZapE
MPGPLLQRYERALAEQARERDAGQQAAVTHLAALSDCLDDSSPVRRLRMRVAGLLHLWRGARYEACCRGIYLWGPVGRGKSWLVDLFQLQQARQSRRLHFQHLMRNVHAELARLRRRERPLDVVAAQMASRARVWCVDEFEVTDIADAMILHGLVAALLARGVVLVMTSNTPPARLYAGGLQRERFLPAIALLERQLDVVELAAGPDYRLRQLEATSTYLDSGDPQTLPRLRELFTRLAGTAAVGAGVMRIEDRQVPTCGHAGALAWFEFAALCEGPRSAADYIALAQQLHTVFLSGVPRLDGSSDDAARRFIALIDELYDRRVRLVISAAAEPAGLYAGERLRGQFERTASRLMEMRTAGYLAGAPAPR